MFDSSHNKLRTIKVLPGSFPVNDSDKPGIGMDRETFFVIRHGISLKKRGPGIESKGLGYCLLDLCRASFAIYDHADIRGADAQAFCHNSHGYSLMLKEKSDDMGPVKAKYFQKMKRKPISNLHAIFFLVTPITPWYGNFRRKEPLWLRSANNPFENHNW